MKHKIQFDPGSVLLLGVVLFSSQWKDAAALLVAAVVHEMGHLIAFFLCGVHMNGVRFTLSGPVLHYEAANSGRVTFCTALAGPTAGLLFACAFYPVWPLCAKISLLLSVFNLLPVLPLDGGRAIAALCRGSRNRILLTYGFIISSVMMIASLFLTYQGKNGFGLFVFGAWLLLLSCQEQHFDVK